MPRRVKTRRPARSPAGWLGSVMGLLLSLLARSYDAGLGFSCPLTLGGGAPRSLAGP
jgi:hypothetical protein